MAISYNFNASPSLTLPQTAQSISDLFNLQSQSSLTGGQAESEKFIAAGDFAEANAYGSAEDIATGNARLARIGGQIEQSQEAIKLGQTLGSQRAATAANGFAGGGSAADVLRSSTRQGLLEQQITGLNAEMQAGGYEQQAAASRAEADAAYAAGKSATAMGKTYSTLSTSTKTMAATFAAAMHAKLPSSPEGVPTFTSLIANSPLNPNASVSDQITAGLPYNVPTNPELNPAAVNG